MPFFILQYSWLARRFPLCLGSKLPCLFNSVLISSALIRWGVCGPSIDRYPGIVGGLAWRQLDVRRRLLSFLEYFVVSRNISSSSLVRSSSLQNVETTCLLSSSASSASFHVLRESWLLMVCFSICRWMSKAGHSKNVCCTKSHAYPHSLH